MVRVSETKSRPALDGLYQQLLSRGVQYFLPGSHLELANAVPLSTQVLFRTNSPNELSFQWLGNEYAISGNGEFTDHERRILRSICQFLSTRYELLFERDTAPEISRSSVRLRITMFRLFSILRSSTVRRAPRPFRTGFRPRSKCFESACSARTRTKEFRRVSCCSEACRTRATRFRNGPRTHCATQANLPPFEASTESATDCER
jgi:hypothetical protein